jgi:hypothetical protein
MASSPVLINHNVRGPASVAADAAPPRIASGWRRFQGCGGSNGKTRRAGGKLACALLRIAGEEDGGAPKTGRRFYCLASPRT